MSHEEEILKKRFIELANKSTDCGYFLFTDFLGLAEQSLFSEASMLFGRASFKLFGGADGTERIMARFGNEEELGYSEDFPISVIKAEPKSQKFAQSLSHRDFLGAILNLRIERSCIGDIVIIDNVGYIFAKNDIANYVKDSLTRVKNTDICASICETLPEGELYKTETVKIQLSGVRIDAAVAKVFSISRDSSLSLFKKGLVFVNGKECTNNSYQPKDNDVISVRGHGRFIWCSEAGVSRKGKLIVEIKMYK
jgi:RNA-binding protein YlmH